MTTLVYKTSKNFFEVRRDSENRVSIYYPYGNLLNPSNTAGIVKSFGGVEQFIAACESSERSFAELWQERKAQIAAATARKKERAKARAEEFKAATADFVRRFEAISEPLKPTLANVQMILSYCRAVDHSEWKLPEMLRSDDGAGELMKYRVERYDCDGKIGVAIELSDKIEFSRKYACGPAGYFLGYAGLRYSFGNI